MPYHTRKSPIEMDCTGCNDKIVKGGLSVATYGEKTGTPENAEWYHPNCFPAPKSGKRFSEVRELEKLTTQDQEIVMSALNRNKVDRK